MSEKDWTHRELSSFDTAQCPTSLSWKQNVMQWSIKPELVTDGATKVLKLSLTIIVCYSSLESTDTL
ncbi:hypothetical protein MTR_8g080410 [Medicago truncatula]|uniref:Uncharacterized protein n=1 Tax=Medicago truncatula TaxID=3880 RepID=A0A072TTR7_MEDTR|nr:hypothetical protein MTR_8g080410 [Medicago truncatula]